MLWNIFFTFLKIGFVSFGGGYAVIPVIQYEVSDHAWLTSSQFQQAVALASMAPGSIATNIATLIGYKTAGILGAVSATLGMILPSLVIIICLASLFFRIQHFTWVNSSLYGLRPVVTGLILYAAIHFFLPDQTETWLSWHMIGTVLICGASIVLLYKYKLHPLILIVAAGAGGIVLF
ncbi:chromate transporter [Paenibacillus shirakamiensis]|uniref:Chromate transporter n=1 Tax=Paenibacillus shirakamiensis TaxID=1265935 RepID=A0ABS4JGK4_9BACL|nr:chromate transporter [Paenibacillus shirakamiensis]MBP2000081.1 chromate transporter [Paenibacillus shirakamiensis]